MQKLFRKESNTGSQKKVVIPNSEFDINLSPKVELFGKTIFSEINNWCKKRNIQLLVITTGWLFFSEENFKTNPTAMFLSKADKIFSELQIPFYDITPKVRLKVENDFLKFTIPADYHPNEAGAKIIADEAWQILKSHITLNYNKLNNRP